MIGILESKKSNLTPAVVEPNTFIGGVADEISTAAALASKLNISESDISYFSENGVDVEARIEVDYILRNEFRYNSITYFRDLDGKIQSLGLIGSDSNIFYGNDYIKEVYTPNAISIVKGAFQYANALEFLYAPKLIQCGDDTSTNEYVFIKNIAGSPKTTIVVDSSLATVNNGSPEVDIQNAINQNHEVIFVENLIKPNSPINVQIIEAYATGFKIEFTQPSHVNTIAFYEIWVDGIKNNEFKWDDANVYATGLNPSTTYNIKLIAVDEFYNKSELSEVVSGTTSITLVPIDGLVSYYKLDGNALNLINGTQGIVNGVTTVTGKIQDGYSYDGVDDYVDLGINGLKSFTVFCWFKTSQTNQGCLISYGSGGNGQAFRLNIENGVVWIRVGSGAMSWGSNYNDNQWHLIVCKIFPNSILSDTVIKVDNQIINPNNSNTRELNFTENTIYLGINYDLSLWPFSGLMDELGIYNKITSDSEDSKLWNNENGTTL